MIKFAETMEAHARRLRRPLRWTRIRRRVMILQEQGLGPEEIRSQMGESNCPYYLAQATSDELLEMLCVRREGDELVACYQPEHDLSRLQDLAMYIAQAVRIEMEDFHAEHLTDEQMRELNPLIRNAIYTALYAMEEAWSGSRSARLYVAFNQLWPDYWEAPELVESYADEDEQLVNDLYERLLTGHE